MIYGVILMALAIYKAAEFWSMSSGFKGLDLVKVLVVDQVIYFVLLVYSLSIWQDLTTCNRAISCCVLNLIEYKLIVSNAFLECLLESLGSPSLLCVLGSIVLFNLKEAGEQGLNQGTSFRVSSVGTMEFTSGKFLFFQSAQILIMPRKDQAPCSMKRLMGSALLPIFDTLNVLFGLFQFQDFIFLEYCCIGCTAKLP